MKKLVSSFVLFVVIRITLTSQGIDNENFVVTHGPWLQNLTASGVTVVWTTNKPAVPGIALTASDGQTRFVRNCKDGIIDGGGMLHKVRVEGLEKGTTYNYSINSVQILKYQAYRIYYGDTLTRRPESFTTLSGEPDKVNFTVINDVHGNSWKLASYLKNGDTSSQDLYFFNGDMVDFLQETDQLFRGFIDTSVAYFATRKPFFYVRGNHETRGYLARDLKNYFDFKDDRFYYSFNHGPVHFIVLDCGEDKPDNNRYYYGLADYDTYRLEELEWLKQDIESENFRKAKHRIVIVHMPIIKEEKQGHGMRFLSEHFGPVLQDSGIDLMISGHTHRTAFHDKSKSGFNYPVVVSSNNTFVEIYVDLQGIKAVIKDLSGKQVNELIIK